MTNVRLDPWYVTGLVDGEGCFCLTINTENKRRKSSVVTYRYWIADFSIHMRQDEQPILKAVQRFFNAGKVNSVGKYRVVHFSIRDRHDIISKLISHFEKFPLRAKKQKDFNLWKEAVLILELAKSRKKTLFDGQKLTSDEENRLLEIRDLLSMRLTGLANQNYLARQGKVRAGKTVLREVHEKFHGK